MAAIFQDGRHFGIKIPMEIVNFEPFSPDPSVIPLFLWTWTRKIQFWGYFCTIRSFWCQNPRWRTIWLSGGADKYIYHKNRSKGETSTKIGTNTLWTLHIHKITRATQNSRWPPLSRWPPFWYKIYVEIVTFEPCSPEPSVIPRFLLNSKWGIQFWDYFMQIRSFGYQNPRWRPIWWSNRADKYIYHKNRSKGETSTQIGTNTLWTLYFHKIMQEIKNARWPPFSRSPPLSTHCTSNSRRSFIDMKGVLAD